MAAPGRARRPERTFLTSRNAVLAIVVCAIALSLAYPVREYIAQRRQIDQLQAQRQTILLHLRHLEAEQQRLSDPAYVEQLARDQLHMCVSGDTCYVVIGGGSAHGSRLAASRTDPWYERLWQSVRMADHGSSQ
jgi:cell division protein FtsL